MPSTGSSTFDVSLTVDDTTRGFLIPEDENGLKPYRVGLAPTFAPQTRFTANNLYEGQPPDVSLTLSAENFSSGAGYKAITSNNPETTDPHNPTVYNYSRGVDLSNPAGVMLSPFRNVTLSSTGAAIDGIPLQFIATSIGTFMITDSVIYQWDAPSMSWVSRDTAGSYRAGSIEFNGYLLVPRGTSPYMYSNDGVVWVQSTRGGVLDEADCFCTRGDDGETSVAYNVIVRLRAGKVSVTTDPTNGAAAWSTEDTIGPSNETANFITPFDNTVIIWKREGIYSFDFANVDDVWKALYIQEDNATQVFQWRNGLFYANYGNKLLEYTPGGDLRYVYPPENADSSEIRGTITGIAGDDEWMYLTITNIDGTTYLMKGNPGNQAWHTYAIYNGSLVTEAPPTVAANDASVGAQAWSNPNNILLNDDSYATATGGVSQYLLASSFGFAIPVDATIDGIEVEVNRKATGANLDTGSTSPSTGSNYSGTGTNAWTNPGNITSSDNTYATNSTVGVTQGLRASDFGFSVPSDATILGVSVDIEHKGVDGTTSTPTAAANAGTVTNTGSGTAWSNPTNAQGAPGADAADAIVPNGGTSQLLTATNFGITIPGSGNTILGVAVRIKKAYSASATFVDSQVQLIVGGIVSGTNMADTGHNWPAGSTAITTYVSYGGSSDLWGASLTEAAVESGNFGVAISGFSNGALQSAYISGFEITVYYQTPLGVIDYVVSLVGETGFTVGDNKASASAWATSDATVTYGSSSDMWGATLTPDFVNSDEFGAIVAATVPTSGEALVDHVSITVYYSLSDVVDSSVRLFKAGVVAGDNKSTATAWGTSKETVTYGSDDDVWGTTWTPAQVNAANFGIGVSADASQGTAGVDFVLIRITYTIAGSTRSSQALYVVGPGYLLDDNPAILSGYGEGCIYFILPRSGMTPIDDPNYRYQTNETAIVVGPWDDYGGAAYPKFLNRGTIIGQNMSAGKPVTLSYEIDSGDTAEIVTATQNSNTAQNITDKVEFNRVRYTLTLSTTGEDTSPLVIGWTLQATLNQPRYKVWSFPVFLANEQPMYDRNTDYFQDSNKLEDFLFAATTARPVFTDRRSRTFNVRIADIQGRGYKKMKIGGEERDGQVYDLTLLEIGPLSTDVTPTHYGRDNYNQDGDWS